MAKKEATPIFYVMRTNRNNVTSDIKKAKTVEVFCKDRYRRTLHIQPKQKPTEIRQGIVSLYNWKEDNGKRRTNKSRSTRI